MYVSVVVLNVVFFFQFSVQLCRLSGDHEVTVLHLDIEGLGTELKLRTFDTTSNTYLREICLKCPEYMGLLALFLTPFH